VKQGRAKGGFISQNERFMKYKWIAFFLEGVSKVSLAATKTARAILDLRERHRQMFAHDAAAPRLLECLYEQPLVSVRLAQKFLSSSYNHAGGVVGRLVERGLLRETTGRSRNRLFRYDPYLALFT
jgi:Fic family protein